VVAATCVRCGAPTDAAVCRPEARTLAVELLTAAGHAEDAEAVITKQARYGTGGGGGNEEPMPVDLTAAGRLGAVESTVGTWARHVCETRGTELPARRPLLGPVCAEPCEHLSCERIQYRRPPSGLAQAAGWLATQIEWLRKRPEAGEAFADLHDACEQLARLVDRPPDKRLVGVCDCGRVLYAPVGRTAIRCPKPCGAEWNVDDGQDILMRHLDDKLLTAGEAARLAAYLDADRTQEQIRKLIAAFARRSLLIAHGYVMRDPTDAELRDDPEAGPVTVPTYRFGDIREQLARTPRRNREGAAA
jgi:hypothetical protein